MNKLVDRFGREHTYLRISVTDRCNLRCRYCMPPDGIAVKPKDEILTFEEIERLAAVFVGMGVRKIRLTGGEPLVRKDLSSLVARIAALRAVTTVALTTNGVLLAENANQLKEAGLSLLNVSLDSLSADRFAAITLRKDFDRVMAGIEAALCAGFDPVKINVVVIAGVNDDEILPFVDFASDKPMNVRFIEYMPFKDNHWVPEGVVSYQNMRNVIASKYTLEPLTKPLGDVAKDFGLRGHRGTVSFITSMTESFCRSCNRLRLTADGALKSCLFYAPELSLRDPLRRGATDQDLEELILLGLSQKPEAHLPAEELASGDNRPMIEIGG